ncbi:hypothetical protein B0H14DRAFT_2923868 [Mycena olivaceomarginata]|nr:hypothetical protein B0H14DRAFT_2923868 [Mycena olivaceomarginata]
MASEDFDARLVNDLKQRVAAILLENPSMSPQDAMREAQSALLAQAESELFHKITDLETKNNPFRPPTSGCPVNDLPPELLAHIFMLGCKLDDEDEGEEEDGDDSGDEWETDDEEGDADEEVVEDADVRMGNPKKRMLPAPPDSDGEDSDDDDDEADSEFDDEPDVFLPFQVLVSHVCRHWREVALNTHTLWTTIRFIGHLNVEKATAWIERAETLPLDIFIDATDMHDPHGHAPETADAEEDTAQPPGAWPAPAPAPAPTNNGVFNILVASFNPDTGTLTTSLQAGPFPDDAPEEPPVEPCISLDDLKTILDLIVPHVVQWRIFEVSANFYTYMYEVLSRLSRCPGAPLLEELGLYNYEENDHNEDGEEVDTFQPAHLAEAFIPFGGNAPSITHVAFWGVHIAWEGALPMLAGLKELELAYHTKDVRPTFAAFRAMIDASPELDLLSLCYSGPTGDMEPVAIPSLHALVLCDLEMDLVLPLVAALELPGLEELTLDLHGEDYTDFADQLAGPARGGTRSLLAGLTTLKLAGLHCSDEAFKGAGARYCPKLESLRIEGISGASVQKLVMARKEAGAPLTQVFIGSLDSVSKKEENWFRANVDQFDFFEPSDDEQDAVEVDPMEMDTDGP